MCLQIDQQTFYTLIETHHGCLEGCIDPTNYSQSSGKTQLISLYAAVGVLAVIAMVSFSINFCLWRKHPTTTKLVTDIRPLVVDQNINGSAANG